jgi:hypothetical protein
MKHASLPLLVTTAAITRVPSKWRHLRYRFGEHARLDSSGKRVAFAKQATL